MLEYLEGETVAERLAHRGALDPNEALKIAIDICDALDKAHRSGIVHRDLKPANVMLTKAGAKLLDFGLAKKAAPAVATTASSMLPTTPPNLTAQGTILGTFQYMAPEQVEGLEADARTDIFAFGAVLFEMLTGKKAFEGRSQASLIAAILKHEPPSIVSVQPLTPLALDRVVRKCLAKDPDARWQSARDLEDELKWIAEAPSETRASAPSSPRRLAPARSALIVAGLLIAAVAVALGLWRVTRAQTASPVARFLISVTPADRLSSISPDERRFIPHRPSRTAMAWSPDGQRLVFSAIRGDKQ